MRAALLLVALAACSRTKQVHLTYETSKRPRWDFEERDGKIDGTSRTYREDGSLESTGTYRAGLKHGVFREYDAAGREVRQTLYINGKDSWTSEDPKRIPPTYLRIELEISKPPPGSEPPPPPLISMGAPRALFTTLDRTTPQTRGGLLLGVARVGEGTVVRAELHTHVAIERWGVYAQAVTSTLTRRSLPDLWGRRTIEVGGTRVVPIDRDIKLSLRAGVLAPFGGDDAGGYAAMIAAAPLRPTDMAGALPSTVSARTSATVSASYHRMVLQADGGFDWAVGGRETAFDPLARINLGAGFGMRSLMLNLELSNVARVRDLGDRMHTFAIGPTLWLSDVYLNGAVSVSTESSSGVHIGGGFAF